MITALIKMPGEVMTKSNVSGGRKLASKTKPKQNKTHLALDH